MSMLTEKEIERIISKSQYWNEVIKRENSGSILHAELMEEVNKLGVSILFILEDYARNNNEVSK